MALPEPLGPPQTLLSDNGYFSAANVLACAAADNRAAKTNIPRGASDLPPRHRTPIEAMAWRLQTPQGKEIYALRKQIPGPVFGIVKSAMGFRQFPMRWLSLRSASHERYCHLTERRPQPLANPCQTIHPVRQAASSAEIESIRLWTSDYAEYVTASPTFTGNVESEVSTDVRRSPEDLGLSVPH